ncbi:NAD+ kinase [Nitrosomonas cryotolerans]|uniref:NAD kinase n=1 Tax=Nitrosomonas cryotolerans ATCC 49181 TaxID=1131553 RepID=A0A1N6I1X1_9PROT|nr:NAD kinase [Nitrosomonas cryotolerans]SFP58667.1 NAD+ kinase [Nitrosomonas cryotolerans]SIO25993.1 NAD+ kinase [Nitrosomonas cryotolerans ATCC 49181]
MNSPFQTIALIGKHKNPEIVVPLLSLAQYLTDHNFVVLFDHLTASYAPIKEYPALTLEEIGLQADLAVVMGGDGTMLNIARMLASYDVPLIGINQGRLGFLTDLSTDTMLETLSAMLDGQYVTERRMLLYAEVNRYKTNMFSSLAFNDVVLYRGISSGMIEFEVRINNEYVYTLRSDGLIVATPTGSTAYALSSGGPILHPSLDLIALVPVCPHTLSNRPIVVGPDASIEIIMQCSTDVRIQCDSHSSFDLEQTDKIIVRRFPKTVRFLHSINHSYYRMLREKLGWSEFP